MYQKQHYCTVTFGIFLYHPAFISFSQCLSSLYTMCLKIHFMTILRSFETFHQVTSTTNEMLRLYGNKRLLGGFGI